MIFVPIRRIGVATCVTSTDRGGPLTRAISLGSNKSASLSLSLFFSVSRSPSPSLFSLPPILTVYPHPAVCDSTRWSSRKLLCTEERAFLCNLRTFSNAHVGFSSRPRRIPRTLGLNEWLIHLIGTKEDVPSLSILISVTEYRFYVRVVTSLVETSLKPYRAERDKSLDSPFIQKKKHTFCSVSCVAQNWDIFVNIACDRNQSVINWNVKNLEWIELGAEWLDMSIYRYDMSMYLGCKS